VDKRPFEMLICVTHRFSKGKTNFDLKNGKNGKMLWKVEILPSHSEFNFANQFAQFAKAPA
jgi:hypothetical protein